MKVQKSGDYSNFKGVIRQVPVKISNAFAKMGDVGEGASIACDFFGKALIVPFMIMTTSKEPKETKEFSAFKNPVAAVIQLGLEIPILAAGSKIVGDCANKGMFDVEGSDFSYNEKSQRTEFADVFEKHAPPLNKTSKDFLDEIKVKGYSNKVQEQFDDIVNNIDEPAKKIIKKSFNRYKTTYKNQFHLKNRLCFMAALILTPLLCMLENKFHPIIMEKLFKSPQAAKKINTSNIFPTLEKFIKTAKEKGRIIK